MPELAEQEKPRVRKGPEDDCEYLVRVHDIIPDERAPKTAEEHIRYYSCKLADLTPSITCQYPQKYCPYKSQEEAIYWHLYNLANDLIGGE